MNKWIAVFAIALFMLIAGCGGSTTALSPDYVGVFKSIRTNNGSTVIVTITADDGINFTGTIDKLPAKGTWGEMVTDPLGLTSYRLDKGNDTNFVNFYLSIVNNVISGTALRQ